MFLPPATNRMADPEQAVWSKALADWLSLDRPVLDGAANRVSAQRLGWAQVAAQYLRACSEAISAHDRDT